MVVLDDSTSMQKNLRWVRANYALKAVAALMDDSDSLLIQPLNAGSLGPYTGSAGARKAIADLDLFVGKDGRTPYSPVPAALDKLLARPETDKWFVVITDGEFTSGYDAQLDHANRDRAIRAGVHSAFILIEQSRSDVADDWRRGAAAEVFDAPKAEDVFPRVRDAATWLNGQARKGLALKRDGNDWIVDSEFPLRRLTLLRQDVGGVELKTATIATRTLPGVELRQHRVRANVRLGGLVDSRIHHLRNPDGSVIEPGKGIVRLQFSGNAAPLQMIMLPDVAAHYSLAVEDFEGKLLQPDPSGVITTCVRSYRLTGKLLDDSGKSLLAGRTDLASFTFDAHVEGVRHVLKESNGQFSAEIPSGAAATEVSIVGSAAYPGYFYKTSKPVKLRFGECPRTAEVKVAGGLESNGVWRAEVDEVDSVAPVRLIALLDGKPIGAEEFARWQLKGGDESGLQIDRVGTEWVLRPKSTKCCLLFWKRPAAGKIVVSSMRLDTGRQFDVVRTPDPITFDLVMPANWPRVIWWYLCPIVYVALVAFALWYALRLVRKERFGPQARFWMHERAAGRVDAIILRKRASFLARWFWPSKREKAQVGGLTALAKGKHGASVLIDGRSLDQRHLIESWTFNESRHERGQDQLDATLRDGSTIEVIEPGPGGNPEIERRYQYSRNAKYPEGW